LPKGGWEEFLLAKTDERRPANLSPYQVATFHAALGQNDKAFVELSKSYQNREAILGLIKVDPRFDSIESDACFDELVLHFKIVP
jgi:hypothetical protein